METIQTIKMSSSDKGKTHKVMHYCNICRGEFDVIKFKDHCICEECVEYIKENF